MSVDHCSDAHNKQSAIYKAAVSLCVYMSGCTPPFFSDTTVERQPNLACKCTLIWELYEPKYFDPPNPRGILGGQKSPGNILRCPENRYFFLTPTRAWGWEFQRLKFQKFMNCQEN